MSMKKIMIVDDEPDQIFTTGRVLKDAGADYEIIPAESGEKCLELLKNNEIPDLILLDIMMPGMSGWRVFDELKDNPSWRNIPVVFLTACVDNFAKDAGTFSAEDYIKKPYDIDDLKKRVDKILKKQ